MGEITSVFCPAFARQRVKRCFGISKVLMGNITLCYGLHVPHRLCVEWVCSRVCHWEIGTESGLRYKDKSVTPFIINIYMLQRRA